MWLRLYIIMILVAFASNGYSQSATHIARQANKLYSEKNYTKAEIEYRKALQKDDKRGDINYNLGCTLQAENKSEEALSAYKKAVSVENNAIKRASSYYNAGVIYQQQKNFAKAIEAYKNALRNNPNHNKARYNLELCRQQQNQQQNKQQNQQQKDNKKKKEQKQQKQNSKSKSDSNKQDNSLSKDNAQRLLDAAMQQEKQTQDKLSKAMRQPSNKQLDKNW